MNKDKKTTTCERSYQLNIPQMLSGGMSENWLLKELGDVHWFMISQALNALSDEIVDNNGERLYASFVRISWEMESDHLSGFEENEKMLLEGELSLYGNKMLFSSDELKSDKRKIKTQMMSIFSSRKSGNNKKLSKGKPLNIKEAKLSKYDSLPLFASEFFKLKSILFPIETDDLINQEQKFSAIGRDFLLEQTSKYVHNYEVDPYDDINGVGLLYFASYPKISDKCERHYFEKQYERKDKNFLNWAETSSCLARDIHYYGNANAQDALIYVLDNYIIHDDQTISLVSTLYRKKDGKCIAKIFTIKKLLCHLEKNKTKYNSKTPIIKKEVAKIQPVKEKLITPNVIEADLEKSLLTFFVKMFPEHSISIDSDLRPLALESVIYIELSEYLNVEMKLSSQPADFFGLFSIQDIIDDILRPEEIKAAKIDLSDSDKLKSSLNKEEDIAIVGMSFRLPGGINTKNALWNLLESGKDVIQKLPEDRWKWPESIDTDTSHKGIDKGGFISDIKSFDADFFKISPLEAEIMDPQQRKLLEVCYHCLEDSGVSEEVIKGSNTGVFVGASGSDYSRYMGEDAMAALVGVGTSVSVLSNRISHMFDLKGPSIQLDTACSSSLVALHQAVQAIRNNECEQALVAGVNCMLHPLNTEVYYKAGMLNKEGLCKTFDKEAAGYVRGEGVLAFLIKPLSQALKDNQEPYAIIKGTAVNHGGNAGGLTVPNPNQQASLIKKALDDAQLSTTDISYIEAHGTGTKLGDPIEINGLKKVFQKTDEPQTNSCHIGSIKTNIGHLEAAAGLAGLAKVLLAFQHKTIPPLANFNQQNPNISLKNTPFIFNNETVKWDLGPNQIKVAGVSSFGSGGTNAHVIVAEPPKVVIKNKERQKKLLITISGDTKEALYRNQDHLSKWVSTQNSLDLQALSYHLLTGRTHLEYRAAFIVSDKAELLKLLSENIEETISTNIFYSKNYEGVKHQPLFLKWFEEYSNKGKKAPLSEEMILGLAEIFVRGDEFIWKNIFSGYQPTRIDLPYYSFKKTSYWIANNVEKVLNIKSAHPLVHKNKSVWNKQLFKSLFKGTESFFKDHQLQGVPLLPGVAYLEMIRYSIQESIPEYQGGIQLNRIFWKSPISGLSNVNIELDIEKFDNIPFSITNQSAVKETCSGEVSLNPTAIRYSQNIKKIFSEDWETVSGEKFYKVLNEKGYSYKNSFQSISNFQKNDYEAWGTININNQEKEDLLSWSLGILDGAMQTALFAFALPYEKGDIVFPFSLEEFSSLQLIPQIINTCYIFTYKKNEKIYIEVLDREGKVLFNFKDLIFRNKISQTIEPVVNCFVPQQVPLKPTEFVATKLENWVLGFGTQEFLKLFNKVVELNWVQGIHSFKIEEKEGFKDSLTQFLKWLLDKNKIWDKKVSLLVVLQQTENCSYASGILGALTSIQLEYPSLSFQIIEIPDQNKDIPEAVDKIYKNYKSSGTRLIWDKGIVLGQKWKLNKGGKQTPWKDNGIYLITGGTGGIGRLLAKEISEKAKNPTILLVGKSPYDSERKQFVQELTKSGANVIYRAVDITIKNEVLNFKKFVDSEYNSINGIIHAAGVNKDAFWIQSEETLVDYILDTKVTGTHNLDTIWKDESLDFLWLFSSIIPIIGNVGQTLYGAANGYMDDYATHRNKLVRQNERKGQTLSINWPYWADGGMQMPKNVQKDIYKKYGIDSLTIQQGLQTLYHFPTIKSSQILVAPGNAEKIIETLQKTKTTLMETSKSFSNSIVKSEEFKFKVIKYFKKLLADFLKKDIVDIEEKAPMERYGINSIMIIELTQQIEALYGKISKTLFFEYKTLWELVDYFIEKHSGTTKMLIDKDISQNANHKDIDLEELSSTTTVEPQDNIEYRKITKPLDNKEEGIAIIGISGRYPKAKNLEQFWDNLVQGKDCITEIPKDRWNYRDYYDSEKGKKGKSYSKWGGFIDDVACFDPLFFNITPLEAEYMDPQERLFLQCAYSTLEDAGYTRERLKADGSYEEGPNIGVFSGVMYEEYQLYGAQLTQMGHPGALGGSPASIANRVSHYFDFHGPSMGIDTMCSSALTAIDLACKSLNSGDCEAALAGAVNTSLHPNKYLMLSQGNFVSAKGKCESFGIGGEGYVPGEGVGIVMLKKVSKAIEDGDQIYGVIRSTAINHGGKTNGYTVPNPHAQAAVIKKAFEKAAINPDHISYVEAHGTGTALGDPIEIAGLNRAFSERTTSCPIGSVKSNIGHCESAAGISGLTKVLLQLKHQQLVPSLHAEILNPNIDFDETIFRVQKQLEPWEKPIVNYNGKAQSISRMASISSFGAGGANAHLIVEEYTMPAVEQGIEEGSYPIVISAKTKQQLRQKTDELKAFLQKRTDTVRLKDIAYTLQIGREPMKYRMAMVSNTVMELLLQLEGISKDGNHKEVYFSTVSRKMTKNTPDLNIHKSFAHKAISGWLEGIIIDWESLPSRKDARIISLPTYPFAKEVYWPNLTPLNKKTTNYKPAIEKYNDPVYWLKKEWYDAPLALNEKRINTQYFCVIATTDTYEIAQKIIEEAGGGKVIISEDFARLTDAVLKNIEFLVDITSLSNEFRIHESVFTGLQRLIEVRDKPCNLLGVIDTTQEEWSAHSTLYKCLYYEYKNLISRSLICDNLKDPLFVKQIVKELQSPYTISEIRISKGIRQLPILKEVSILDSSKTDILAKEKVVWITGGTRGIGMTCAKHLVKEHGIKKLVLSGKTIWPSKDEWSNVTDPIWKSRIADIQEIEALGATIHISAVDLLNKDELNHEIINIQQNIGPINMLFHAAGIADFDTPAFIKKKIDTIEKVLGPKKQGTRLLLEALSNQPIEKVILFSSVSSGIPSLAVGQLDYAIANTYLDLTAVHHSYPFDIISVQWPNWKESGMGEVKSKTYENLGLISLSDIQGLQILDQVLCLDGSRVLMPVSVSPEKWKLKKLLELPEQSIKSGSISSSSNLLNINKEENTAMKWLIELFSSELRIPMDRLETDLDFGDFGVDSIILTQLMRSINTFLKKEIDPSIFYEYSNIERLSQWLHIEHGGEFEKLESKEIIIDNKPKKEKDILEETKPLRNQEYAVIGVSCQFPDAPNIEAYWDLISKGKKAIREVPGTRWNKLNFGYAALLNNIDKFDTEFFMIAPEDAISMDPQALLILEETLHLLYQSGYTKNTLKRSQTGVYIGARSRHMPDPNTLKEAKNPIIALGQNYLAANVSQYFDFQGPSLVIDTACSSALTALDIACKDLANGDIDQAIVGGVNVLQTDEAQKIFDQRGILNTTGDFHIFDARAKGVVLGEGIGMILIKKIENALQDGNKIEAVLSGLAINNDGRTAGHATPNMKAQTRVMEKALQKSNLTANQISHIEVNGSGTELTDLIELKAIKSVYSGNPDTPLSLGSIKPNIGHPLCAEGMASLLKLIGMLKNQSKVPFLSGDIPMKHFDLDKEGFVLERKSYLWEGSILAGAVNCFADGGTNAHVILRAATENERNNTQLKAISPPILKRKTLLIKQKEKEENVQPSMSFKAVSTRNFWN